MCPHHQIKIVFLEKALHDVRAEQKGDTAVVLGPTSDVFVGIRPQEIAQEAGIRHICWSLNLLDLLNALQLWRQPPVNAEDLIIDNSSERKRIEDLLAEELPNLDVVALLAIIIEAIDPSDGSAL